MVWDSYVSQGFLPLPVAWTGCRQPAAQRCSAWFLPSFSQGFLSLPVAWTGLRQPAAQRCPAWFLPSFSQGFLPLPVAWDRLSPVRRTAVLGMVFIYLAFLKVFPQICSLRNKGFLPSVRNCLFSPFVDTLCLRPYTLYLMPYALYLLCMVFSRFSQGFLPSR